MASAARMPTMATTIINSTSVKPRFLRILLRMFRIMGVSCASGWGVVDASAPDHPIRTPGFEFRTRRRCSLAFVFDENLRSKAGAGEPGLDAVAIEIGFRIHDVPGLPGCSCWPVGDGGVCQLVTGWSLSSATSGARVDEAHRT